MKEKEGESWGERETGGERERKRERERCEGQRVAGMGKSHGSMEGRKGKK